MTYNASGQLSTLSWSGSTGSGYTGPNAGIAYNYSSTQNSGQITGVTDTDSTR